MTAQTDPIQLFDSLYKQVFDPALPESAAAVLATATRDGRPSARVILLKGFDERGFTFYTNLESRKSREIKTNPHGALCFYWPAISYQVRVEGDIALVSSEEADAYFASRPRGSQVGAWASQQSAPLLSRPELEARFAEYENKFANETVPRPHFWSGFRLAPVNMEFWKGRENRLHERILYSRKNDSWTAALLFP
jgi:pyridoxamine 5'-phosphate oxidase